MKKSVNFLFIILFVCCLYACSGKAKSSGEFKVPPFPYQSYLDSNSNSDGALIIGDDGTGIDAICHKIHYPEMPDSLAKSQMADSLLQMYNIALTFNTLDYDISTAERFMEDTDFVLKQTDALDSINVSGIHIAKFKNALVEMSRKAAHWLRAGKNPNEQQNKGFKKFYDEFDSSQFDTKIRIIS